MDSLIKNNLLKNMIFIHLEVLKSLLIPAFSKKYIRWNSNWIYKNTKNAEEDFHNNE